MSGFRLIVKQWVMEKVHNEVLKDLWALNTELTSSIFIYSHNPRAREAIEGPEKRTQRSGARWRPQWQLQMLSLAQRLKVLGPRRFL